MKSISVGVPTYLRGMVLVETLDSILAVCSCPVIVVDQTPQHDADVAAGIERICQDPRVTWIKQTRANLPAARNAILRAAKTDFVVFVDDDVLLEAGFVEAHIEAFRPGVAAVAGNVFQTAKAKDAHDASLRAWTLSDETEVFSAIGCNFSVRRETALSIGGFDEAFEGSAFGEEEDFCRRLRKAGYKIGAAPRAKLVHLRSPSGGCRVGTAAVEEWKKPVGWLILLSRYPEPLKKRLTWLKYALLCGPLRRENWRNPVAIARCIPPFLVSMKKARAARVPQGL